jgi:hypothetical protein
LLFQFFRRHRQNLRQEPHRFGGIGGLSSLKFGEVRKALSQKWISSNGSGSINFS